MQKILKFAVEILISQESEENIPVIIESVIIIFSWETLGIACMTLLLGRLTYNLWAKQYFPSSWIYHL